MASDRAASIRAELEEHGYRDVTHDSACDYGVVRTAWACDHLPSADVRDRAGALISELMVLEQL